MIILFDEYGTPTIKQERENEIFVGVAIIYEKTDEKKFFEKIKEVMGLKKSKQTCEKCSNITRKGY